MKLSKIQRSVLWVGRDGHPFGIAEGLWYAMDGLVQDGLVEFLGVGDDQITGHYKVTEAGAETGGRIVAEMHQKIEQMAKKQEYPVKIAWYDPFIGIGRVLLWMVLLPWNLFKAWWCLIVYCPLWHSPKDD